MHCIGSVVACVLSHLYIVARVLSHVYIVARVLVVMLYLYCSIRKRHLTLPAPEGEDEEVLKERATILQDTQSPDDLLVLRNLTKIYGTRCSPQYRLAVNQLCLRMEKGEVGVAE